MPVASAVPASMIGCFRTSARGRFRIGNKVKQAIDDTSSEEHWSPNESGSYTDPDESYRQKIRSHCSTCPDELGACVCDAGSPLEPRSCQVLAYKAHTVSPSPCGRRDCERRCSDSPATHDDGSALIPLHGLGDVLEEPRLLRVPVSVRVGIMPLAVLVMSSWLLFSAMALVLFRVILLPFLAALSREVLISSRYSFLPGRFLFWRYHGRSLWGVVGHIPRIAFRMRRAFALWRCV